MEAARRSARFGAATLAAIALGGCAPAPSDGPADRPPSFRFAAQDEGLVRETLGMFARGEDLLPPEVDPKRPEPVPPDRLVFRQRIDRRDFPLYKSLWANQVPFDPEWKVEFVFRPDGDSTTVTGITSIRTREPPDGEWNEHPVREGHVSESVRSILEKAERLLPEGSRGRDPGRSVSSADRPFPTSLPSPAGLRLAAA